MPLTIPLQTETLTAEFSVWRIQSDFDANESTHYMDFLPILRIKQGDSIISEDKDTIPIRLNIANICSAEVIASILDSLKHLAKSNYQSPPPSLSYDFRIWRIQCDFNDRGEPGTLEGFFTVVLKLNNAVINETPVFTPVKIDWKEILTPEETDAIFSLSLNLVKQNWIEKNPQYSMQIE